MSGINQFPELLMSVKYVSVETAVRKLMSRDFYGGQDRSHRIYVTDLSRPKSNRKSMVDSAEFCLHRPKHRTELISSPNLG